MKKLELPIMAGLLVSSVMLSSCMTANPFTNLFSGGPNQGAPMNQPGVGPYAGGPMAGQQNQILSELTNGVYNNFSRQQGSQFGQWFTNPQAKLGETSQCMAQRAMPDANTLMSLMQGGGNIVGQLMNKAMSVDNVKGCLFDLRQNTQPNEFHPGQQQAFNNFLSQQYGLPPVGNPQGNGMPNPRQQGANFMNNAQQQGQNYMNNAQQQGQNYMNNARQQGQNYMHNAQQQGQNYMNNARQQGQNYMHNAQQQGQNYINNAQQQGQNYINNAQQQGQNYMHNAQQQGQNYMHNAQQQGQNYMNNARQQGQNYMNNGWGQGGNYMNNGGNGMPPQNGPRGPNGAPGPNNGGYGY